MKNRILCLLAFGLVSASAVNAHHSMSTYDLEQQVTVEGTVTRVQWVNPHVFIYVDQVNDTGVTRSWAVEGINPSGLRKVGWSRDTLKLGDFISVTGNPSKSMQSPGIYPQTIMGNGSKLFDEQEYFAGVFSVQEAETGSNSLAGVWKSPLNPAVILPKELDTEFQPDIGLHDVSQTGLEALAQFDELTMNPALNCEQITAPLIMHFGDNKEISIEENIIRISSEYDGGERFIHMDKTSHEGAQFSNQGHSIGKWVGDTLVIDTEYFSESNFGNGFGLPSSHQKQVTEQFTLSADGKSLSYEFTLTDPVYLASPMSLESQWTFQPNAEFILDECDLESARRFLQN